MKCEITAEYFTWESLDVEEQISLNIKDLCRLDFNLVDSYPFSQQGTRLCFHCPLSPSTGEPQTFSGSSTTSFQASVTSLLPWHQHLSPWRAGCPWSHQLRSSPPPPPSMTLAGQPDVAGAHGEPCGSISSWRTRGDVLRALRSGLWADPCCLLFFSFERLELLVPHGSVLLADHPS